jgi:hypothetical protein
MRSIGEVTPATCKAFTATVNQRPAGRGRFVGAVSRCRLIPDSEVKQKQ